MIIKIRCVSVDVYSLYVYRVRGMYTLSFIGQLVSRAPTGVKICLLIGGIYVVYI